MVGLGDNTPESPPLTGVSPHLRPWLLTLCALGCGEDALIGTDLGSLAAMGGGGGSKSCHISECDGHIYQCGDCLDNDGDGVADSADPECLGPCDNTEDSFYGGIPGQNNSQCRQDCYFDQDTGAGNDECFWSHACDLLSVDPLFTPSGDAKCAYDPALAVPGTSLSCLELQSTQSDLCRSYCGPLTPNGCDCFGCCELPAGSGQFVWLGSTEDNVGSCDANHLDDPLRCHPCTPVQACLNECKDCEICVGRPERAPTCTGGAGGTGGQSGVEQCAVGSQTCGIRGQEPCPEGEYCVTGCCVQVPH